MMLARSDFPRYTLHEPATFHRRWCGPPGSPTAAALHPTDGRMVVGYPNRVEVWDPYTGRLGALLAHPGRPSRVGFAGARVWAVAYDGTVRFWDAADLPKGSPGRHLSPDQVAEVRRRIAGPDLEDAFAAIGKLTTDPTSAVAAAREQLSPALPSEAGARDRVRKQIAALADADYGTREAAFRELKAVAVVSRAELVRAEREVSDPEARWRLARLLEAATEASGYRAARYLELLERVNTPEARALVKDISTGDPDVPLTIDARDTLARMNRAARK